MFERKNESIKEVVETVMSSLLKHYEYKIADLEERNETLKERIKEAESSEELERERASDAEMKYYAFKNKIEKKKK